MQIRCLPLRTFIYLCLGVVLLAISWTGGARAQEAPDPATVTARFSEWNRTLERIGRDINGLKLDATQIDAFSEQAAGIRSQALEFASEVQNFAGAARELRDAYIASVPAGETESAEVQAQGKELKDRVGQFEGWLRQIDLTIARTDQLLDKISTKRLDRLAASLTERGPVPLNPLVWARAGEEAWAMVRLAAVSIADEVRSWRRSDHESGIVAATVLAAVLVFWLAIFWAIRLIERQAWPVLGSVLNGPASRTALSILRDAMPWFAAIAIAQFVAPLKEWLPEPPGRAAVVALMAAGLVLFVLTLTVNAAANFIVKRTGKSGR